MWYYKNELYDIFPLIYLDCEGASSTHEWKQIQANQQVGSTTTPRVSKWFDELEIEIDWLWLQGVEGAGGAFDGDVSLFYVIVMFFDIFVYI